MNSNYGKSNNFDFDLGLSSNNPSRSLNHQKNQTQPSSIRSNTTTSYSTSQPRPSWTHQSSALPTGPTSMVGDIFGKTWSSSTTTNTTSTIGIVNNKNPNLFGDLVTSALGQNKGNSNVPLKNVTPVSAPPRSNESAKVGNSVKGSGSSNWGNSSQSFGSYTSNNSNVNNNIKNANLGGSSMRGFDGGIGGMSGSNKDPFGSLVDFGSKPAPKGNNKSSTGDDAFGNFQNAAKSSTPGFTSVPFPANSSNSTGSNSGPFSNLEDFAIPVSQNQPPPVQSSGVDVFDSLFTATSASAGGVSKGFEGVGSQQFSVADDWGSEFGGGNDMVGTTELEGLPPPPAGVSASTAKNKGMDNYKQGQYADAIKWLSWAVILLEKASDDAATTEVLSSRASCYKEVGEYKKAVADCTKVLQHDGENIAVLVQRALLYESMEKYKLGAEDLRAVMKLDPTNRVAKSTIHRLIKMAD